jgi:hypothetical protein
VGLEQPTRLGLIFLRDGRQVIRSLMFLKKFAGDTSPILPKFQRPSISRRLDWSVSGRKKPIFNHILTKKKTPNTLQNISMTSNKLEISSKTHSQLEIKIIFGFRSTILDKFNGKKTPFINFSNQKELIDTKITRFHCRN